MSNCKALTAHLDSMSCCLLKHKPLASPPSALGHLPSNMPYLIRLRFPAELCKSIAEHARLSGTALIVHDGFLWAVDLEDTAMHPLTFRDLEEAVWLAIDAALDAGLDEDEVGYPHRFITDADGALWDLEGSRQEGYMPFVASEVHPQPPTRAALELHPQQPELEAPELEAPVPELEAPAPELEAPVPEHEAPAPELVALNAFGLATMVGDRSDFHAHVASGCCISFRIRSDHTWMAINFDAISRFDTNGARTHPLKVNAHITLLRVPTLDPEAISVAVVHGQKLVDGWLKKKDISQFTGRAAFLQIYMSQPDYAWADLLVGQNLTDTCHTLATELCRHMKTRWTGGWYPRREFHISFETWKR